MKKQFIILPSDRIWLEKRIAEIEKQIKDLGPEFHEVLNQSSETWHDNAPFDAVREKQDLLVAERASLRDILIKSTLMKPKPRSDKVYIGHSVILSQNGNDRCIFIAGDWTPHSGKTLSGKLVVSCVAPLARELVGKKVGDLTKFGEIIKFE